MIDTLFFVTSTITGLFGILGDSYIILCLVYPINKEGLEKVTWAIHVTIGTSSFLHAVTCITATTWATLLNGQEYLEVNTTKIIFSSLTCTIFCNVLVTSLLFFLYWGRIVPLKWLVVNRLKERLARSVPWIIANFMLMCLATSSFVLKLNFSFGNSTFLDTSQEIPTDTQTGSIGTGGFILSAVVLLLIIILPFCVMVFTSLSILLHLKRHIQQLHREKRITHLLINQLLVFTTYIIILFFLIILESMCVMTARIREWATVVPCWYSATTSCNMILRNAYLRKTSKSLCLMLKGKAKP